MPRRLTFHNGGDDVLAVADSHRSSFERRAVMVLPQCAVLYQWVLKGGKTVALRWGYHATTRRFRPGLQPPSSRLVPQHYRGSYARTLGLPTLQKTYSKLSATSVTPLWPMWGATSDLLRRGSVPKDKGQAGSPEWGRASQIYRCRFVAWKRVRSQSMLGRLFWRRCRPRQGDRLRGELRIGNGRSHPEHLRTTIASSATRKTRVRSRR